MTLETSHQVRESCYAHQNDNGAAKADEVSVLCIGEWRVTRYDSEYMTYLAVGDGNSRGPGNSDRTRYAGNDANADTRSRTGDHFFAATAEDEGISPLEAHDRSSRKSVLYEQAFDACLGYGVMTRGFADIDEAGARG